MTVADAIVLLAALGSLLGGVRVLLDSIQTRRSAGTADSKVIVDTATQLVHELRVELASTRQELKDCEERVKG